MPYNMIGGQGLPQGYGPGADAAMRALQTQQYQKQSAIDGREAQDRQDQRQFTLNKLDAERMALDQSRMMQANANNPRTVQDTRMNISNEGTINEGSYSGNAGGGGKVLPPQIEGRYMALVGNTNTLPYSPDAPSSPRATMGEGSFKPGDAQAYQDAEFSRSKAQAGDVGRSAMNSLRGELAGRGILGSGTEMRGTADRLSSTLQPLADLNVAHLRQDYDASQLERSRSEAARLAQYQGDISQRGQDLSSQSAFQALKAQLAMAQARLGY